MYPQTPTHPGFGWRELGLTLLVFFGGSAAMIIMMRFIVVLLNLPTEGGLLSPPAYITGIGFYLMLLLGMYLFGARRAGWAALGVRTTAWYYYAMVPLLFVIGVSAVAALNMLIMQIIGAFENPQVEAISGGAAMSLGEFGAGLLLIAVLVPLVEELFFRGMLYPLLRQHLPMLVAVILNAAIFSAIHLIPVLLPSLFVVGLILAFLRERSGSIWPGVLYHMFQNGMAMLLIYVNMN
ncbi:Abortive infection protein [Oscillochloris trichoides DG-6]|uniref:Abortive infection protein n=1 Tax=Oscillochloris trichoides DG-6 TaxID=765420 RepID=E1IAK8_9CHLR|nr:type II CAAX endopeptidase family protein [Oscillochloris trichoides]EFO81782.1 Abortive infection protein [Oscillochloris trichoides DG-6]